MEPPTLASLAAVGDSDSRDGRFSYAIVSHPFTGWQFSSLALSLSLSLCPDVVSDKA